MLSSHNATVWTVYGVGHDTGLAFIKSASGKFLMHKFGKVAERPYAQAFEEWRLDWVGEPTQPWWENTTVQILIGVGALVVLLLAVIAGVLKYVEVQRKEEEVVDNRTPFQKAWSKTKEAAGEWRGLANTAKQDADNEGLLDNDVSNPKKGRMMNWMKTGTNFMKKEAKDQHELLDNVALAKESHGPTILTFVRDNHAHQCQEYCSNALTSRA